MEFVKLVGPFGTIFIMFALGLNLTLKDFILTIKKPNNLIVGLFCQLIILPLIGLILVKIYQMRDEFQLGVFLLLILLLQVIVLFLAFIVFTIPMAHI